MILMAVTSSPLGSTAGSTSTNVTTAYCDQGDFDYAEVRVTNIGSKAKAFEEAVKEAASTNKFNNSEAIWAPLVESSSRMTESLLELHGRHQQAMEKLVAKMDQIVTEDESDSIRMAAKRPKKTFI